MQCSKIRFWPTVLSVEPLVHCVVCLSVVCNVLYCGETVRPSKKLSEGVNRKPGSKSSFLGSPPYFYFPVSPLRPPRRPFLPYFCSYSPVLDGTNGVSSSKPCAYCRIVCIFKWTVNAYSFALRVVKAYVRNCSNLRPYDCIWTVELVSHVSRHWAGMFITASVVR